jgi:hypothetical protein
VPVIPCGVEVRRALSRVMSPSEMARGGWLGVVCSLCGWNADNIPWWPGWLWSGWWGQYAVGS